MRQPLDWQIASVKDIKPETAKVKTFTLTLPSWTLHRAGQHYDIRLTAEDGYVAQRSYSIASEPEQEGEIELTIERIEDGEVSTYMHDVLIVGDGIEVRGPIGGYFVWEAGLMPDPLVLIAGGSGVVPLMSMIRHRTAAGAQVPTRLLYSSRMIEDVIYYDELEKQRGDGLEIFHTLTRSQPEGWKGYARRIDDAMLKEIIQPFGKSPQVFICGPTLLVESAANTLVKLGIKPAQIRTERFGPTGTAKGG
ncbi:MAG TPA: ferredoxin reductase [Anaerolineales bacterium]|jgi:ferredoxin-NADP reductase|nr:ferredoxin reductase [Anaerolineales bacterium]